MKMMLLCVAVFICFFSLFLGKGGYAQPEEQRAGLKSQYEDLSQMMEKMQATYLQTLDKQALEQILQDLQKTKENYFDDLKKKYEDEKEGLEYRKESLEDQLKRQRIQCVYERERMSPDEVAKFDQRVQRSEKGFETDQQIVQKMLEMNEKEYADGIANAEIAIQEIDRQIALVEEYLRKVDR